MMWEHSASVCDVSLPLKFRYHKSAFCIAPHHHVRWGQIASALQGCAGGCHCPALLQAALSIALPALILRLHCVKKAFSAVEGFLTKCFFIRTSSEKLLILCVGLPHIWWVWGVTSPVLTPGFGQQMPSPHIV